MTIKDFENKLNDAIGNTYPIGYNNLILSSANLIKEDDNEGQTNYTLNINFIEQNICSYFNKSLNIDINDLNNNYGLYLIKTAYPIPMMSISISTSCNYNKTKSALLYSSLDGYFIYIVICNNNDIKQECIKEWRKII